MMTKIIKVGKIPIFKDNNLNENKINNQYSQLKTS